MTEKIAAAKKPAPSTTQKASAAATVIAKKAVAVAVAGKPKAAAVPALASKVKKPKKISSKIKMVRGSFGMPQSDYAKIGELKQLCLKSGVKVKKNQLLRAGLHALVKMSATQLKAALSNLDAAPQTDIIPGK